MHRIKTARIKTIFPLGWVLAALLVCAAAAGAADPVETSAPQSALDLKNKTTEEIVSEALTDSLFYEFDKWFSALQKEIDRLEAAPKTMDNRVELMKYNFYFSGMLGEVCHTLAFTSKYRVEEIAQRFLRYSYRAKELAQEILDSPEAEKKHRAQAYLFLGGAEGYIAIFEYGEGNLLKALINGYQADNHLEKALELNPDGVDAHFGLGMYRYGNSRLGGFSNFIMQGGRDLRQVGLDHIEQAVVRGAPSRPLALKTLAWFFIAEQINPLNADIPAGKPLSVEWSRARAIQYLDEIENRYFKNPPYEGFIGNKELAMMQALQHVLDSKYAEAKSKFEKILVICDHLKKTQGFAINPQLIQSVEAGIRFSELMLLEPPGENAGTRSACLKVNEQLAFLKSGGSMVEYDAKKIRSELHAVFEGKLNGLAQKMRC